MRSFARFSLNEQSGSTSSDSSRFPAARYWNPGEGTGAAQCELCPRQCLVLPGRRGKCGIRLNQDGRLTAPFYGRYTSLAVDPIEKKPLYHFFPASQVLSVGTAGCNLSCRFCQNWQISQEHFEPASLGVFTPEEFASLAVRRGVASAAFTYNEPSIWAEFVIDAALACRKRGIKTVAVTNGMIRAEARRDFYAAMDAVNIDLKAFQDGFYRNLCGGTLDAVKDTIRYVARETGVWLEVTNLIIPTRNDSLDDIARMCEWLVETAGVDVPVHFSAFFPTYRLTDAPRTPPEILFKAIDVAGKAGLQYAYAGNVPGSRGQATLCPECGKEIVHRTGYRTSSDIAPETPVAEGETRLGTGEQPGTGYSLGLPASAGGYSFAARPLFVPVSASAPKPTAPKGAKGSRGVCPHCRTVIAGRFF